MRTQAVCWVKQTLSHLPTHIEPVCMSATQIDVCFNYTSSPI
jgi:hypothetical protein